MAGVLLDSHFQPQSVALIELIVDHPVNTSLLRIVSGFTEEFLEALSIAGSTVSFDFN
jgi:hypothetical protein